MTAHRLRLVTDRRLRRSIAAATITAWRSLGRLDARHEQRLRAGEGPFALLYLLALLPFLGGRLVALWGNEVTRRLARRCLSRPGYFWRAMRRARIEALIGWTRAGRVDGSGALLLVDRPLRFWAQRLMFGWLPAGWHRFLANPAWARQRLLASFRYALRFLRRPEFREQVLVTVSTAERYQERRGDLGWSASGVRARLSGIETAVEYPHRRWDGTVAPGDTVDTVVRPRFFGGGYVGLSVSPPPR